MKQTSKFKKEMLDLVDMTVHLGESKERARASLDILIALFASVGLSLINVFTIKDSYIFGISAGISATGLYLILLSARNMGSKKVSDKEMLR